MLKASESNNELSDDNGTPQILGDDVPLLSPALGFHKDVAMVTSTRELRRLTGEQIIQLNGQEVALRTIPDGCEFLMRWRYRDIQRFLSGENTSVGEVFNFTAGQK